MKLTIDRTILSEACLHVSRAVSTKSTLPALEGLLLKGSGESLEITGYDLELGIKTTIPAAVSADGEIILNARLFCDIVRSLPEENVSINADTKCMTEIKSGDAEFSIMGIDAGEFPSLPVIEDEESFLIEGEMLSAMFKQTLFAVAQTDVKPVLTGVLFEIEDGVLTLVALDGYRLAMRKEAVQADIKAKFIVPGKTVGEILKLVTGNEENVEIIVGPRHIMFRIEHYYVISRLLEGSFIDYKAAIPASFSAEVIVSARAFINSIERISLLITDRLKSPVRCVFADNMIKNNCITTIGKANDQISVTMTEDTNIEMGFNNKYLLDALKVCDDEEVKIELSGPLAPMKIVPVEGNSFLFLVLPVRLKAEG